MLVLAVASVLVQSAHVLVLVIVAVLLACGLEPFVGWMRGRTGAGRTFTILAVYAGFFVLVVALGVVIVPAALGQVTAFSTQLPDLLAKAREWAQDLRPEALGSGLTGIIDGLKGGRSAGRLCAHRGHGGREPAWRWPTPSSRSSPS